jgi:hypothetical protein
MSQFSVTAIALLPLEAAVFAALQHFLRMRGHL